MIGYVTLGTNNIEKAAAFYDRVLGVMGAKRAWNLERFIVWMVKGNPVGVALAIPYNGDPATVGNGVMVALSASSAELVDQIYAEAIAAGGTDEGPPGDRGRGFYAGYFRDLDGNKFNAFTWLKDPSKAAT